MTERRAPYTVRQQPAAAVRRAVAFHEAGHALVAHIEGFPVRRMRLRQDADGHPAGQCILTRRGTAAQSARPGAAVRCALAGVVSALHHAGTAGAAPAHTEVWPGSRPDIADAYALVKRWKRKGRRPMAFLRQWERTRALLVEHWPAVERLAGALLATGRLDRGEIAALLGEQAFGPAGADHPQQAQP